MGPALGGETQPERVMDCIQCRSIFISDVHLGTPDCKAEYLLDFLRRSRSEFLYLVGDIVDLESLALRPFWPSSHAAILGELMRKADTGTRVIYIPGNHDAALRGLCGQRIGSVEVQRQALHVGADGRRFRVSHGDEFDPHDVGKRWLYWIGEHARRLVCVANRLLNRWRKRFSLPYLPLSIITKSRVGRALEYIRSFEHEVSAQAAAEGLDGHICGHIHYGGIRRIDGVLYCNDGDWVEHCTALLEDEHGTLELLHWSEQATSLAQASGENLQAMPEVALVFASLAAQQPESLRRAA